MEGKDNLILQTIPAISTINTGLFHAGDKTNVFSFGFAPQTVARLGIFVAKKNNVERAVMMLLPQSGKPDGILICVTQKFGQAGKALNPLGWAKPLAPGVIKFALLKHVVNRWGPQMLASRKNLALVYILREQGANELGPFASDGKFFADVIKQIVELTNNAFSTDVVEAFTFSSGIYDFNQFTMAVGKYLPINTVYSIDPANSMLAANSSGGRIKQFASGAVGGILPGFEPMPLPRWENEELYNDLQVKIKQHPGIADHEGREYLHNTTMPKYTLYLALNTA